ncbi:transposable element Tcb2 transposase [Trichonephila clavipes]|nr:transposable element Tcb2 transposase [Trichonephila clavipes]
MIFYVVELLDDWNGDVHSLKYPRNFESPRVSSPGFGNDSKMMVIVTAKRNKRSTASDLSRQLSSATGTTVSRQTVCRCLRHMGLYARAEFLFMDDNARPHHANIVGECLQSEDITRMDWLAYSLDLNPIEHVWDMLGRRIAARQPPPTCLPLLRRALLDE